MCSSNLDSNDKFNFLVDLISKKFSVIEITYLEAHVPEEEAANLGHTQISVQNQEVTRVPSEAEEYEFIQESRDEFERLKAKIGFEHPIDILDVIAAITINTFKRQDECLAAAITGILMRFYGYFLNDQFEFQQLIPTFSRVQIANYLKQQSSVELLFSDQ